MNRNFVAVLMSTALACLAVAFVVIEVISDSGPTWAWVVLAVAAAAALHRVGTPRQREQVALRVLSAPVVPHAGFVESQRRDVVRCANPSEWRVGNG